MKKFLLFLIFIVSSQLHAGILFEPYLGYHLGSFKDSSKDVNATGFGIGSRGAYVWQGIMIGGDLQLTALDTDTNPEVDYEQNQLGLLFGYAFPVIPLRAWFVFNFYDQTSASPGGKYYGNGLKIGFGGEPLPYISVNMEYKSSSYDEVKAGGPKTKLEPSARIETVMFSVSFLFYSDVF